VLSRRGTNVHLAAVKLVQVGKSLRSDEGKAAFDPLRAADFDMTLLDLVEPASRAVIYLETQVELAAVGASQVKLPLDLVTKATEVRGRMLKVVSYYLDDDPVIGPQIAFIISGQGYLDLQKDLVQLATIYHGSQSVIAGDTGSYRPTDEADAFNLAARIEDELEAQTGEKLKGLQDQALRAWTLLNEVWDEVCAAGRFIYRKRPEQAARFAASAFALGRKYSGGRSAGEPGTETGEPAPVPV
jgi:hypothetical protein